MPAIVSLLVGICAITAIGMPLACQLSCKKSTRISAAPVIGAAIAIIASSALYPVGVPLRLIGVFLGCVACCVGLRYAYRALRHSRLVFPTLMAFAPLLAYAAFLFLITLLASPNWAVFQGNHWDHFSYESSAIAFTQHSHSTTLDPTPAQITEDPLLLVVRDTVMQRPSAMYSYALLGTVPGVALYRDGYLFLLICSFLVFCSTFFIAANLANKRSRYHKIVPGAIAIAAAAGFYGQLAFDINAWSAFLATSILSLGSWCVASQMLRSNNYAQKPRRDALVTGMLLASGFIAYPEGASFFFVGIVLTGLAALIWRRSLRSTGYPYAAWVFGSAAITVFICQGRSLLDFLVWQSRNTAAQSPTWWQYFDRYLFGYDTRFVDVVAAGLSATEASASLGISLSHYILAAADSLLLGIFGLYFLNDSRFGDLNPMVIATLAIAVIWLFWIVVWLVRTAINAERSRYLGFAIFVAISIGLNLYFVVRHEYWAAGKVLLWISPLLAIALCSPLLLYRAKSNVPRLLLPFTVMWIIIQLGFALTWPLTASTADGIHREMPYPAVQDVSLKNSFNWDIEQVSVALRACPITVIDVGNPWVEYYIVMAAIEVGSKPVITDAQSGFYSQSMLVPSTSQAYCRVTRSDATVNLTLNEGQ